MDSAAHQGAIDAGGKTVVVMGSGFDHLYPVDNAKLFQQAIEYGGAWLSLYPPHHPAQRWTFLARNELLAAMVEHVVVVQAPIRSGARSTMAAARRMGKTTWAVPGSPWDTLAEGCMREIELGAKPLVFPQQMLGLRRPTAQPQQHKLSDAEQAVVNSIAKGPTHLDGICDVTGLAVGEASALVLSLTLRRVVKEASDGRFFVVSNQWAGPSQANDTLVKDTWDEETIDT